MSLQASLNDYYTSYVDIAASRMSSAKDVAHEIKRDLYTFLQARSSFAVSHWLLRQYSEMAGSIVSLVESLQCHIVAPIESIMRSNWVDASHTNGLLADYRHRRSGLSV